MAKRPVFIAKDSYPFYKIEEVEFQYYSGFAVSQKQRSIRALHNSFSQINRESILEVSTKSTEAIGVALSAFNLPVKIDEKEIPLECVFQGSKCFDLGGPYTDIYAKTPSEAKKDIRLKESGELRKFVLQNEHFGNDPKDFFYNWIYINALYQHDDYLERIKSYSAFTDIEFNPQKSINCQAKAIAIAVGLIRAGLLEKCIADKQVFLETVYQQHENSSYEQMSLFDIA